MRTIAPPELLCPIPAQRTRWQHLVAFGQRDFVVWYAEASDATDATNSGAGSNGRWGDFVTCRRAHPDGELFSGTGYAVLKNAAPATGTRFNPRYILFGRKSANPDRPIG